MTYQGSSSVRNPTKSSERGRFAGNSKIETKREEVHANWRNKESHVNRDKIFDKRKEITCYNCNLPGHFKYSCPKLKKSGNAERVNHVAALEDLEEAFEPYVSRGIVNGKEMRVLRDTGTNLDLISVHDVSTDQFTGERVWVRQPLDNELRCLPLVELEIDLGAGVIIRTKAATVDKDTDMNHYLLGNKTQELIDRRQAKPHLINAVITRQASRKNETADAETLRDNSRSNSPVPSQEIVNQAKVNMEGEIGDPPGSEREGDVGTSLESERDLLPPSKRVAPEVCLAHISKEELGAAQKSDDTLTWIRQRAAERKSHFKEENGIIIRKAKERGERVREQIVIPREYRKGILSLCHEGIGGHLGIKKTKDKIFRNYFWPNAVKEIEEYVKSCDPCQRIGKSGDQGKAPLTRVPIVTTIFTRLCADTVGPLPLSENGNRYMLTAMCVSSRYPEAIPIKDIRSVTIIEALTLVFSRLGFARELQTDLGTSFVSNLTSEFLDRFGIKVVHSSVHRPESQMVERWHRTVKRLLKVLCLEAGNSWEKNLPYALLALRTVTHESTGFSPSELVHGRNLRTPEKLLYEKWKGEDQSENLVTEYVFDLINRMKRCQDLAVEAMTKTRENRKKWYDRDAIVRNFKVGDKVLVLALNKANKFSVNWIGPGTIEKRVSETNYVVNIPHRRTPSQIYHVNLLKPYLQREQFVNLLIEEHYEPSGYEDELDIPELTTNSEDYDFQNIVTDSALEERCDAEQINELSEILGKMKEVFSNDPGKTDLITHDIELISEVPVRLRPYRTSPRQSEILRAEIKKMLELGVIIEGESDYNSPLILVESPGREPRPCIDYRKLNAITRPEVFPLPNIEQLVERVASANYITTMDLSKGYWQIPMSKKAQRLAAFVTSWGSFLPVTMPFGLIGASYRFSKFVSILLRGLEEFCLPYLDDFAVFSDNWNDHMKHIELVLERIREAKIKVKLSKCKFAQRTVKYLGHMVGDGRRTPAESKIQAILEFPAPRSKTEIRRFLGMCGYYARYIRNYATLVEPLTNALKGKDRKAKINWNSEMEEAFNILKKKLTENPVLFAPNYAEEFIVQTDASDKGIGIIMAQRINGEEHPVIFLSRKFTPSERKFTTSEKECAAIIYAIKKLRHYLDGQRFRIETDHNSLVWLKNNAGNNPRLCRWSLILQPYQYTIKHRPGKQIPHVDALSRVN